VRSSTVVCLGTEIEPEGPKAAILFPSTSRSPRSMISYPRMVINRAPRSNSAPCARLGDTSMGTSTLENESQPSEPTSPTNRLPPWLKMARRPFRAQENQGAKAFPHLRVGSATRAVPPTEVTVPPEAPPRAAAAAFGVSRFCSNTLYRWVSNARRPPGATTPLRSGK
jgi:hypothetical protein